MKVLIITNHYPDMFGGVGDYTYHIGNALRDEGCEVIVLTTRNEKVRINNDKVIVLPKIEQWGFSSISKIIEIVKEIQPDFVNIQYVPYMYNHWGIPLWLILFSFSLRLQGFRLITTFHEVALKISVDPKLIVFGLLQRLIAYTLALTSCKVIVSIEYWKKLLFPFKNKISKIPIGSNILPISFSNDEKLLLKKTIAPGGEFIIVTFGTVNPYRDHNIFLMAIREILQLPNPPGLKILFLGYSSDHFVKDLENKIKELNLTKVVNFLGYLDFREVFKYLSTSDIFVLLRVCDRKGVSIKSGSIAAAYAASLPILSVKGELTDEFFKEGENIFFARSLSVHDLANALMELLENSDLREKLSIGAKKTYREQLEWHVLAKKYKELLEQI